jgi:hypothetical protein
LASNAVTLRYKQNHTAILSLKMALVKPKRIMLKSKNMASFESILSRDSYLLSLELRAFWLIAFAYGFAFLFFLFHLMTGKTAIGKTAQAVFGATATAHVILIVFRIRALRPIRLIARLPSARVVVVALLSSLRGMVTAFKIVDLVVLNMLCPITFIY